ncbi:hypothetical protein ABZU25_06215 [Micromonospora sp. NPDC005215]|uniref:hypothetical protein n=1 Tax=Micromonospora sp. NPDC005215 TaxID=3157024 RepID=UPI0033B9F8B4
MQSRFRRTRRASSVIAALAMIATGLVGLSPAPAQASTIDGPIDRGEIMRRAQNWVDRGITYTQDQGVAASDDEGSHKYRRDCSGLVSMVWHLDKKSDGWDYNTNDFQGSNSRWFTLASRDDWQPGDAMVRTGHMELFAFWADRNDHGKGAYVYSFNNTGETVQNPKDESNFDNLGFNSAGDLSSFKPIRRTGLIASPSTPAKPQATKLSVALNADGRMQAFQTRGSGAVYSTWQSAPNSVFGDWANLGGNALKSPTAVTKADGRIELFAIGGDGKLYHKWQSTVNGPFSDWTSLGGSALSSDLNVATNADGRLQVFVIGGNGSLYSIWQTTTSGPWSAWANLGGTDLRSLSAVKKKDGRIELFAIGGDGKLYHKWQNTANGPFSDWTSLGGNDLTTELAISANADGRLQVFVIGGNGALYSLWQTTTSGPWSDWTNLDGTDLSAVRAVTKTDGRMELFAIGGDGKLYHKWQTTANGPFSAWTSLGGNGLTTDLAISANADGRLQVFVIGGNGALYSLWQTTTSGPWSAWTNLG